MGHLRGWYIPPRDSLQACAFAGLFLAWAPLLCRSAPARAAAPEPADLVLRGGVVYTVDASRSWAQAVAIRKGRLAYVGSDRGVAAHVGPSTKVVELGGRLVLPGFVDAHIHPVTGGIELGAMQPERPARCAGDPGEGAPVRGGEAGAGLARGRRLVARRVPGRALPTREALDALVPDRPVFLSSADGHSSWVNTKALALAGIDRDTKDPKDGRIERDARGEAMGTLRESASGLVSRLLPEATRGGAGWPASCGPSSTRTGNGLTALQEASAGGGPEGGGRGALEAYREARAPRPAERAGHRLPGHRPGARTRAGGRPRGPPSRVHGRPRPAAGGQDLRGRRHRGPHRGDARSPTTTSPATPASPSGPTRRSGPWSPAWSARTSTSTCTPSATAPCA